MIDSNMPQGGSRRCCIARVRRQRMPQDKTLVVWDFKSSEPLMKPYFDFVKKTFEEAHPGVKVKEIAQPADNYYTVLGTAINAKQGPDVVLLNGGNLRLDRADAWCR